MRHVDDVFDSGLIHHPHRRDVVRPLQGCAQANGAMIAAVVIFGRVGFNRIREDLTHIHHHVGCGQALAEACQVSDRLERRAGLAFGEGDVHLAIDIGIVVVQ